MDSLELTSPLQLPELCGEIGSHMHLIDRLNFACVCKAASNAAFKHEPADWARDIYRILERACDARKWSVHAVIAANPRLQAIESWECYTDNCEISIFARVRNFTSKEMITIEHETRDGDDPDEQSCGWEWHHQGRGKGGIYDKTGVYNQIDHNLHDEYYGCFISRSDRVVSALTRSKIYNMPMEPAQRGSMVFARTPEWMLRSEASAETRGRR